MKVEEKNESDLKQDQSNNPQSKKDTDVVIEKDKIQDEKNKEAEGLESKNKEELNGKKVKELEEKILRTLAEMENQRRRFEKERDEALIFEFSLKVLPISLGLDKFKSFGDILAIFAGNK